MHLLKSFSYRLHDTLKSFKQEGVRQGIIKVLLFVRRIFYVRQNHVVLAKALSRNTAEIKPLSNIVIRQVQKTEGLILIEPLVDITDTARFRKMLTNGSLLFIALHKDQVIGWGWISDKLKQQTHPTQVPLQPGQACLHDLFVVPAYRGQGIAQQLVAHRLQFLYEQKYTHAVISCVKDNIPALKVAWKAGYTNVGESTHVRLFFWERLKYTPY